MEKLDRKIKYVWIAGFSVLGIILGAGAFGLLYFYTGSLALLPSATLPILFPVYAALRYGSWRYESRDDHFYLEHGVFTRVCSMVPHVRIQHIDTDRGPLERLLGLSTLRIYTAGSKGADVKVPGLDKKKAGEIQRHLREVAIESEKGLDAV